MSTSSEESFSALSAQLVSRGHLTRPLDLSTLFLPPPLPPSDASSKHLKRHQDMLVLQARAREQLSKCLWGMLERSRDERETVEGLLSREERARDEAERERTAAERARRERETMARELEVEKARAKDAEAKLKTEQERHRHAKDELAKMKSAVQFLKTQSLHDQKRREAEVTSLHQRLQKLTTSSDSAFTRFTILNQSTAAGSPSGSSPLSATFGGRTSRLSSTSGRSATPPAASSSAVAATAALESELHLLNSSLSESLAARQHLEGENRALREFVGEVGEWADGVVEMDEFRTGVAGEEEGEEVKEVLEADGDQSYLIPSPHLSLPVSALVTPLHRKLYAIRLGLSSLSSSSASRLASVRAELEADLVTLQAQLEDAHVEIGEGEKEREEMEKRAEEADRLVREFVESRAEGRRVTMARGAESDDDSVPAPIAAALAAQKTSKRSSKPSTTTSSSSSRPAPPPASTAPRPSEPPSAGVAAFLSELGLDTPAVPAETLVSDKVRERQRREVEKEKERARFGGVTGSVERQREKRAVEFATRPSVALTRRTTSGSGAGSSRPASSSAPSSSSSSPASNAPSSATQSSALSSILALADSPPVSSQPLVSSREKKVLAASSAVNSAVAGRGADKGKTVEKDPSRERKDGGMSEMDKVKAKKAALLERARAARG
ncbi:hypothetical protein JCM8097_007983 [Rhodosporidiobolus ruineniae]